jgi:hypothetical protein
MHERRGLGGESATEKSNSDCPDSGFHTALAVADDDAIAVGGDAHGRQRTSRWELLAQALEHAQHFALRDVRGESSLAVRRMTRSWKPNCSSPRGPRSGSRKPFSAYVRICAGESPSSAETSRTEYDMRDYSNSADVLGVRRPQPPPAYVRRGEHTMAVRPPHSKLTSASFRALTVLAGARCGALRSSFAGFAGAAFTARSFVAWRAADGLRRGFDASAAERLPQRFHEIDDLRLRLFGERAGDLLAFDLHLMRPRMRSCTSSR